jgi:hypothetical protein
LPVNVIVFETVSVLPSAIVSVDPVAGAVMATLLMLVAVAAPSAGVTSVGPVARTTSPVPVELTDSIAVPPELMATIFPPFPVSGATLSNANPIFEMIVLITDDLPAELFAGLPSALK